MIQLFVKNMLFLCRHIKWHMKVHFIVYPSQSPSIACRMHLPLLFHLIHFNLLSPKALLPPLLCLVDLFVAFTKASLRSILIRMTSTSSLLPAFDISVGARPITSLDCVLWTIGFDSVYAIWTMMISAISWIRDFIFRFCKERDLDLVTWKFTARYYILHTIYFHQCTDDFKHASYWSFSALRPQPYFNGKLPK